MEDKDITFSMTSGIGHFVCCNFGAKQVFLSISQIAVPLYLAKVVVGRSHPFVGLRHFRPLAARWERLQWGSMCLHGPPSCEKRFLLQLHVCFWSQFIFLWHLLTFPDLCRVLIQVLLVKNLRGILWKHFSVRARLPNLLSGHNLRIRYDTWKKWTVLRTVFTKSAKRFLLELILNPRFLRVNEENHL